MIADFALDLPLLKDWSQVEQLREATLVCLTTVSTDADFRDQVAMVVGELMENAVKYGDWSEDEAVARVRVRGSRTQVEITVSHPIAAEVDLAPLLKLVRFIDESPNAEAAYISLMRDVATRAGGAGGLGLARIAYEGNCQLRVAREGTRLSIQAITRAEPEAADVQPH